MTGDKMIADINEVKLKDGDVGSTGVQIVQLTHKIKRITEHLKENHKDVHTRHGLLKMVSKRKRLMKYLKRKDFARFESVKKLLGLRHG